MCARLQCELVSPALQICFPSLIMEAKCTTLHPELFFIAPVVFVAHDLSVIQNHDSAAGCCSSQHDSLLSVIVHQDGNKCTPNTPKSHSKICEGSYHHLRRNNYHGKHASWPLNDARLPSLFSTLLGVQEAMPWSMERCVALTRALHSCNSLQGRWPAQESVLYPKVCHAKTLHRSLQSGCMSAQNTACCSCL